MARSALSASTEAVSSAMIPFTGIPISLDKIAETLSTLVCKSVVSRRVAKAIVSSLSGACAASVGVALVSLAGAVAGADV